MKKQRICEPSPSVDENRWWKRARRVFATNDADQILVDQFVLLWMEGKCDYKTSKMPISQATVSSQIKLSIIKNNQSFKREWL